MTVTIRQLDLEESIKILHLLSVESQMNVNIFISRKKGKKLICMIKRLWRRNDIKLENYTRKRTLIKKK
jgi:hypothetical protein